jgi:hypothetical protein
MKIYTKQGDAGWTRLANGEKTRKSDVRVDLYGTADELNSHIGLALSQPGVPEETRAQLLDLQHLLFELGSELAGYYKNKEGSIIREEDTGKLEQWVRGNPGGKYPTARPSHWACQGKVGLFGDPTIWIVDGKKVPRSGVVPMAAPGSPVRCRCVSSSRWEDVLKPIDQELLADPYAMAEMGLAPWPQ